METISKKRQSADLFNMVPAIGYPNAYIIQSKELPPSEDDEMSEADWDKFEQDVNNACEQIP